MKCPANRRWFFLVLLYAGKPALGMDGVVGQPASGPASANRQAPLPSAAAVPTLDDQEWAFVTLLNQYRAQKGAGPLEVSVALENSSRWMSQDMASKNYFSHTD